MSSPLVRGVCFHGVGEPRRTLEPGEDGYWVGREDLLRILDEVMTWPAVSITFDDGNASDLAFGVPALLDRGLSAAFFVLAGRLDTPGSLSRADVADLVTVGMEVGTHGMDHRSWRGLSDADLQRELVEAREAIAEASGAPVTQAACPLGHYDRTVLNALRRDGYGRIHTSDRRPARRGAWVQPRFSVRRGDTADTLRSTVVEAERAGNRALRAAIGMLKRLR